MLWQLSTSELCSYLRMSFYHIVPSAYPKDLKIVEVTPTCVTFEWTKLKQQKHNRPILGYQYIITSSTGIITGKVEPDSGSCSVVTGKCSQGQCSVRVAAVNSAGLGIYSPSVDIPVITNPIIGMSSETKMEMEEETQSEKEKELAMETDTETPLDVISVESAESAHQEQESSPSKIYDSKCFHQTMF